MATGEPQTSSAVRVPAEPEIAAVQVIGQEALAELDVPVAQVELEALAGLEDQVVQVVRVALAVPESPVASVGLAVRAAPVVLANRVAPVARAVRVAPVGLANRAALELAPVEVVPERDPVVLPLRTKSATALHRRDRVAARRRVEDSAVAAETTREPAVTEVARVWEAAE
jgi:hypothetical protein